MTDISRRKFIQLTVLSGAVAATGCRNETIYKAEVAGRYGGYANRGVPYLNEPDGMTEGVPQYFATACQMCPAGCGLFVKTMGGHANQAQGNPDHPVSGGKICARGSASMQHLYDPARLRFPALRTGGRAAPSQMDWETALSRTVTGLQAARGQGSIAILTDGMTFGRMPTLDRLIGQFAASVGGTVTAYSLLDDAPWRAAARAVYGQDQIPAYQLDQADFILAFSSNFLEAWPSPVYYSRLFGEFRQGPRRKQGEHGKFVFIGPRMSMTAAKADQWIPCNPGTEGIVAQAILTGIVGGRAILPEYAGVTQEQVSQLVAQFQAAGTRAVALGGDGIVSQANATETMTAIESLNVAVKSQCVGFGQAALPAPAQKPPPAPISGGAGFRQMQHLIGEMQAGQVGALVVLGQPNPVFTLPQATGFTEALAKVPFIVALTPFEDETTAHANVLLPTRTFLEDWGDDVPALLPPGVRMASLRQPIIDPQFIGGPGLSRADEPHVPWMDTRSTGDLLIDLSKRLSKPLPDADTRAAVRRTWAGLGQADLKASGTDNDPKWVSALAKGGYWGINAPRAANPAPRIPPGQGYSGPSGPPAPGTFALHLYPHIYWTDGRHANLSWMQELPDPMTSAVWNSWVEINMDIAHEMDIRTGDIVRLTGAGGRFIDVPAVPYPGLHPGAVAMPIGQGHTAYGREVTQQGQNPLAILAPTAESATGALAYGATTVQIKKISSAQSGYHPEQDTLVLVQDRPGGQEPEAVMNLIHTTAKE
nr:molybdopterin-dependent oxidoreductase [Armatimonadota bacterium]